VVAHLVFHIPLFVPGVHVAEGRLEPVVFLETEEGLAQVPLSFLEYLDHDGGHVVEPQPRRNSSNMFEDCLQPLEEAFPVLSPEELEVAGVAVGEGDVEVLPRTESSVFVKVGAAEVHLGFSRLVLQRQCGADARVDLVLLLLHVGGHRAVGTTEVLHLRTQTVVYALGRVALFPPCLHVALEPFVDLLPPGLELGPPACCRLDRRRFVEVLFLDVLPRGFAVDAEPCRDGADGAAILEIGFSDIIDPGHCEHPPFPPPEVSG